jgi:hypothetical protein
MTKQLTDRTTLRDARAGRRSPGVRFYVEGTEYLEHASEERVMRVISIGDPEFDELRSEPRFAAIVRRLRLPEA